MSELHMTEVLPAEMRAQRVVPGGGRLALDVVPRPEPNPGEVLIRVHTCGVCRTDLHILDGDLPQIRPHIVPGHEVVGTVVAQGEGVESPALGVRVGVPWLGHTCGRCEFCASGHENLCDEARFTGYHNDGGYAEFIVADPRYCFELPEAYSDQEAAPLLCAGLIGYRAYRMAGEGRRLGLYGFGAAAHILVQIADFEGREVYAFTRPGDSETQAFARELGAVWAGGSDEPPPVPLDAAILFAPVGALVPEALAHTVKGGRVVCAGIHMSAIPGFAYSLLWGERSVCSVANLTRQDGIEFFELAPKVPVRTQVRCYALEQAEEALGHLRAGRLEGAAVLKVLD
jgi:propanol-preferring alcohol dehydrogenase